MYKLAYIIPTKDSAEFMDACLNAMKLSFLKLNTCVYVLDASEDDATLHVCEKHKSDGITYEHLLGASLSYRFFRALNNIEAEYICIGKDNHFPTYEGAQAVMKLLDKGYDMLELTWRDRKHIGEKEYHGIAGICRDCAWDATLYGTVFLKKAAYKPASYEQFCEVYGENIFYYLIYYYNYPVSPGSFRSFYCKSTWPYGSMPAYLLEIREKRGGSSWRNRKDIFEVWGKDWIQAVNFFEPLSPDEKKQVILDHGVYALGLSRAWKWADLRIAGLFDYGIYKKYRDELLQISTINSGVICAISVTPVFILRVYVFMADDVPVFVRRCLRKVKSLLSKLFTA